MGSITGVRHRGLVVLGQSLTMRVVGIADADRLEKAGWVNRSGKHRKPGQDENGKLLH